MLSGADATGANIEPQLSSAEAIHFAGHAAAGPEGVRLLLADGMWRPPKQHLELAVLSACATAQSEEQESPGPQHLAHAFLLDGAQQVVAARWNVDSAVTAEFMKLFYRNLSSGQTAAAALQEASRYVRSQPG